jgi:hypothetical protein
MTNSLSIILGVIFLALIGADQVLNDGIATVFTIRKLLELIGFMAFWR